MTISMGVSLITHTDVGESKVKSHIPVSQGPIALSEDCYLGANVTVSESVRLGKEVVVGAGSMVRKSFEDRMVIAGVPAKAIRKLDE